MEIDTTNKFGVGIRGNEIRVARPVAVMSKSEALILAAWLVVLADDEPPHKFLSIVEAVQNG